MQGATNAGTNNILVTTPGNEGASQYAATNDAGNSLFLGMFGSVYFGIPSLAGQGGVGTSNSNMILYTDSSGASGGTHSIDFSPGGYNNVKMVITSSGNVGIGTSTPLATVDIQGPANISSFTGTSTLGLMIRGDTSTGAGRYEGIDFNGMEGSTVNPVARIAAEAIGSGSSLFFGTSNSYASGITNTAMTISPSGNVGIGTSSPLLPLTVQGPGAGFNGSTGYQLGLFATTNSGPQLLFGGTGTYDGDNWSLIAAGSGNNSIGAGKFSIFDRTAGFSRLTVDTAGNVGIGTTSPQYLFQVGSASVASGTVARFQNANGTCDINPTTNTLACSSDERLKKDIIPYGSDALGQVMALQPVFFNWDAEASGTPEHPGFIAQQVQQLMPEVVSTDPNTGLLSIGYSDLVPAVVSATQQMQTEITTLQGGLNGNATATNLSVYSPSNFSGDSVGEVEIPAGQTSVRVTFSQQYAYQPIVTLTPTADYLGHFWVEEADASGFTIETDQADISPLIFNWHSFASLAEQLTVSGSGSPIQLIAPSGPQPASAVVVQPAEGDVPATGTSSDASASSTPAGDPATSSPVLLGEATATPSTAADDGGPSAQSEATPTPSSISSSSSTPGD